MKIIEPQENLEIALLGLPLDENASFMRGPAQAPPLLRAALHSDSSNLSTESGLDLGADSRWGDAGDLDLANAEDAFRLIEQSVGDHLSRGIRVLALGGDHSVTYPVVRAYGPKFPNLTILHIDAHPDLYDSLDGNPRSHASPFARIMENKLASRLVQVGIRTMNPHQKTQAERFEVEVVEMRDWVRGRDLALTGPLYLSLDLDALDPAFVPGVSHHEPGGFSTRDVVAILQEINVPLIGADLVEFNPAREVNGVTAMVGAKLIKEILGKMLETGYVI